MTSLKNLSPEASLAVAVLVSIVVAILASTVPVFAFGSFWAMLAILVAADLVVYIITKLGFLGSSADK